ncbi:MAG: Tetratricopeptide repeat protein [bacterium ADurb.Bin157]|nr:MAG: Tetratricopeptide repeat protein [bacterium ADurb.Bin157]
MIRKLLIATTLILCNFLIGCTDPNAKANQLYVEAIQYDQEMKEKAKSYTEALATYKKLHMKIDEIINSYPEANLAVKLQSGETLISGKKVSELRKLEILLQQLSEAERQLNLCALVISENSKNRWRVHALCYLAIAAKKLGEEENCIDLINKAIKYAEDIDDNIHLIEANLAIANAFQQTNQNDKAKKFLKEVLIKAKPVDDCLAWYTLNGLFHQQFNDLFLEATEGIKYEDDYFKEKIWETKCFYFLNSGELDKATQTALQIEISYLRESSLVGCISEYIVKGQYEKAISLFDEHINDAGDTKNQIRNLVLLAWKLNGKSEKSLEFLDRALSIAQMEEDQVCKIGLLAIIGELLINLGHNEKALQIMSGELFVNEKINSNLLKKSEVATICQIASVLVSNNKVDQAIEIVKQSGSSEDRIESLLSLAKLLIKKGKKEFAQTLAHELISLAGEIDELEKRRSLFALEIGCLFLELDNFDQAMQIADGIEDKEYHDVMLYEITRESVKKEQPSKAIEACKKIKDIGRQGLALAWFALYIAENKKYPSNRIDSNALTSIIQKNLPIHSFWH